MMYPDAILVKLTHRDNLVSIQTIDRRHHKSDRFFITNGALLNVLCSIQSIEEIEFDIGNFARIRKEGEDKMRIILYWMRTDFSGNITGFTQSFTLPFDTIRMVVDGEDQAAVILDPDARPKSRIEITPSAQKLISKMDKAHRNAFRKAMRDNFQWGDDDVVSLYADFGQSFYFSTPGLHGGLVCHTGKDGTGYDHPYYQIHT